MKKFRQFLLIAYIVIIIGHIVLYYTNEESLISFIWGVLAMIFMVFSVIVSKRKEE